MAGLVTFLAAATPSAAEDGNESSRLLTIDKRLLSLLETRLAALTTRQEVEALLGKADISLPSGNEIMLYYEWELPPKLRVLPPEGDHQLYLSGVSFRIDSASGRLLKWSFGFTAIVNQNGGSRKPENLPQSGNPPVKGSETHDAPTK